jgi:hypothetical protein
MTMKDFSLEKTNEQNYNGRQHTLNPGDKIHNEWKERGEISLQLQKRPWVNRPSRPQTAVKLTF